MAGLKTGLAAVVLWVAFGAVAGAQGIVPGGWAAEFGYQSFGGMGIAGGGVYGPGGFAAGGSPFGFGYNPYGGAGPAVLYGMGSAGSMVARDPRFYQGALPGMMAPAPQTFNATGSLIGAIRQTTRRSTRR